MSRFYSDVLQKLWHATTGNIKNIDIMWPVIYYSRAVFYGEKPLVSPHGLKPMLTFVDLADMLT